MRLAIPTARRVLCAIHVAGILSVGTAGLAFFAGPAGAAVRSPGITIDSLAAPTNFSATHNAGCLANVSLVEPACDVYHVTVTNAGSQSMNSSGITLSDALPEGLTVQRISLYASTFQHGESDVGPLLCTSVPVKCEYPGPFSGGVLPPLAPDDTLKMDVYVTVDDPSASDSLTNTVTAVGGGAPEVVASSHNQIASTLAPFGVSSFNFYVDGLDGARDTQAGDHPYEMTATIDLNSEMRASTNEGTTSVDDVKDVVVDLPLGFAGSTLAAPECTLAQLSGGNCPGNTVIGHLLTEPGNSASINSPIWNLVPERGVPAEFGYVDVLKGAHVFYVRVVPSPSGYVLQSTNPDTPQIALRHIVATFYGDPAERDGTSNANVPFFTNPTGCDAGPLVASIHLDSWQNPGRFNADGTPDFTDSAWASATSESPPVTGCSSLLFTPEVASQPTTHVADSPSGLEFEMKLPQTENAGVHATPALKRAEVTLPEGMTVDPSAGDGLQACSDAQIGWLGGSLHNFSPAAPECPEASKIGSLELTTPLIPGTLDGALYIARQNENPFGSVLAAYVVVDDPITGVLIKLAGRFLPDPQTGRITAVFDENPQLPFSDLKLHFFGGPRAELTTPESCGLFTTSSDLTPWSAPESGPDSMPSDGFLVESGCVNGFAPNFTAGSTNLQAGAYTPFVASFYRQDTDQDMAGLGLSLPPGLLASLTGIPLCPDAEASAGTCPAASQVGTVNAGAGPGPNPLFVEGKVYLTGPYNGGPYGLSVVVPAIAGPFDFGNVVVRQSLRIDPIDAHVTDVSDPFPTILKPTGVDGNTVGIPIHLKRVDVRMDRPGFTFNPTRCSKQQISGSMSSTGGLSRTLAVPFQVTKCATLGFKPRFTVSTNGKTSRATGASLHVKLVYPKAPFGSQANIKSVKVDLPKQLPSQLKTLQRACPDYTFEQNPAGCSAESRIGTVRATTPLLPVALTGPVYFVSHAGLKFPELVIILSGYGTTVQLHAETFISKAGITSSTFRTIPDVPVGTFELTLPQGKYSALAAPGGNLCKDTLTMPTIFTAQNGSTIKQSTPISVTGCPKHVRHERKKIHRKRK